MLSLFFSLINKWQCGKEACNERVHKIMVDARWEGDRNGGGGGASATTKNERPTSCWFTFLKNTNTNRNRLKKALWKSYFFQSFDEKLKSFFMQILYVFVLKNSSFENSVRICFPFLECVQWFVKFLCFSAPFQKGYVFIIYELAFVGVRHRKHEAICFFLAFFHFLKLTVLFWKFPWNLFIFTVTLLKMKLGVAYKQCFDSHRTRTAPGYTSVGARCGAGFYVFKSSVPGAVLGAEQFKIRCSVRCLVLPKMKVETLHRSKKFVWNDLETCT